MFKPLIKKVREESSNSSTLPEKTSDEANGHLSKDNLNSIDEESGLSTRTHRRANSTTFVNKSKHSDEAFDKKEESIRCLADIFSPYIDESISIDNYIEILKAWIDSKEAIFREKDDVIQSLTQETIDLKNETNELRIKLTDLQSLKEKNVKNLHSQKQIDTLRSENENLKSDIKSLRKQLNDVETERDDLLIKSTDVKSTDDNLQRQLAKQKAGIEEQKLELEKLRQALLERDAIIEQQDKRLLVDHETQAVQTEEDKSFVEVFAEPDVDTIGKLQAELDDKNRTIKNLQQRYNDLRKTLQREFNASVPKDLNQLGSSKANPATPPTPTNLPLIHYDASATSQSDVDVAKRASSARQMNAVRKNVTFTTTTASAAATVETSPAILPHTSVESKPQRNGHRSSIEGQNTINGTNFKYLKHVLLKFMTSTEDEAVHLIRAVSTLLNFSADEERLLRETLDYKMSWFGKVARHKPISSNTNF